MENHKETSFERKNSTCSLCFSARGVFTESQTKEIKEMKTMQTTARQRWTALTLLAAIEFMILLDTSIVNIALPSIQSGLHFSEADLGWVQNLYQLIFGSLLLFGGRAADLFGRRKLYLLGLALFTLGSLLAGLAPSAAILLLARAMQGLGAAVVIPAEKSLLATIFTDPQE